MNVLQRLILLIGIVAVVGMSIYPPWSYAMEKVWTMDAPAVTRASHPAGYFFIMQPPQPEAKVKGSGFEEHSVRLDVARLATQEIIAVIATAMGVLSAQGRRTSREPAADKPPWAGA